MAISSKAYVNVVYRLPKLAVSNFWILKKDVPVFLVKHLDRLCGLSLLSFPPPHPLLRSQRQALDYFTPHPQCFRDAYAVILCPYIFSKYFTFDYHDQLKVCFLGKELSNELMLWAPYDHFEFSISSKGVADIFFFWGGGRRTKGKLPCFVRVFRNGQ